MAVVVTAVSGYDLGYVWKGQGAQAQPERSAGGYYINAAQQGEPPGRWWGPGARALGFADGQVVERGPYEQVYRQIDPRTGVRMGRSPGNYDAFADWLVKLKAAEPHATAERLIELEREAAKRARTAPAYTDMTVSFSKSISVFHASIRENERRARLAGDQTAAAYWAAAERRYQEVLQAANRAGLEYVQEWAGITRTGYHGARVEGKELGRFEEALITVTSWLQGTSRDGDPQDHIHNQIARIVQTVRDGKHRALDTATLRHVLGAVQGIVATHAEAGLSREFGVAWTPRKDGIGNEITGVTQAQMDAYSSRAASIAGELPNAVAAWTAKYGRAPNQRELLFIQNEVTLTTRQGKEAGAIDWDALCARWEERWDAQWGPGLASVASRVSDLRPGAPARGALERRRAAARGADPRGAARAVGGAGQALDLDTVGFAEGTGLRAAGADQGHGPGRRRGAAGRAGRARPCRETSSRWSAWRRRNGRRCRGTCAGSWMAAASTPGRAPRVTPPGCSSAWRKGCCAPRSGKAPRTSAATMRPGCSAPTRTRWRRSCSNGRRSHASHATGSGLRLDQGAALFHALTSDAHRRGDRRPGRQRQDADPGRGIPRLDRRGRRASGRHRHRAGRAQRAGVGRCASWRRTARCSSGTALASANARPAPGHRGRARCWSSTRRR